MRTSFLTAPGRAAFFALAACLSMVPAAQAVPVVSMYMSGPTMPVGGSSLLVMSITDDVNGGFTGGTMSITYPPGIVNDPQPYYNGCAGSVVATPGAGGMSATALILAPASACYIEIYLTSSVPGSYTITLPAGGLTASSGSNATAVTAPFDVIAPTMVTSAADSGPGTLRQAILDTNASCVYGDEIHFNIPGAGPNTIQPVTQLPNITCGEVVIDGYTQPGAAVNTDSTGGNNATIKVILNGSSCTACDGLYVSTSYPVIRGLSIVGFGGSAISLNAGASVYGNYLGTDPGGMAASPNGNGVNVLGYNSDIGSMNAQDRNLISGNAGTGIQVGSSGSAYITNNQIGGRRDGSAGMGNGVGVYFNNANYSRSYVQSNYIRSNSAQGVVVDAASLVPVIFTMNAMSGNGGIGIDLNGDGPTLNDETGPPYDTDTGPNRLMNYPVITSMTHSGSDTIVQGYVKSVSNSDVQVQLFDNPTLPSNTEGAIPLTTANISLDATGFGTFNVTLPGYLANYVSAAATTDTCNDGCDYSSEYSPAVGIAVSTLSCSMYVQFAAMGDAGVSGAPSVVAPPGGAGTIQPLCSETPVTTTWNTTETTGFISVTGPAAGASATYTVTVTSAKSGSGTFSVTLVGANAGTPVCAINPASPLPFDPLNTAPFNVNSACAPAATGFAWNAGALVGGQGTATGTYQYPSPQAGYGYTVTMAPTNAAGEGPSATRIIWFAPTHIDTTPLAFPTTPVGSQSAAQSVTVQNLSDYYTPSLTVTASGPFVVTNNCANPVPALTNCTIDVKFAPTVAGAGQTGTLTVTYPFPGNPSYSIALTGSATGAPVVTLTPSSASLTFAARTVSTSSAPQTVTVANTVNLPLTIASIMISGDFSFTSTCATTLAVGASCTIDVTFTPLVPGARTGTLTITDDAAGSPHMVALSGTGLSSAAAVADVSTSVIDFSPQPVGSESAPEVLTVTNSGTAPLTFDAIGITGEFALVAPATAGSTPQCPITLAAGGSCEIYVTFRPTGPNTREGLLTIVTNAGTVTVRVIGTGLIPAPPQLTMPSSLTFDGQAVGTRSAGRPLPIRNTSELLATITVLSASGDFSVSDTCATIVAGATCSPLITFAPTALGPRTGTLTVRTLRDFDPYTVSLSGAGVENRLPVLQLSATSMGFGNAFLGQPVTHEVTVRNAGTAPLIISSILAGAGFFSDTACITTIAAGASCLVHVTFLPGLPGSQFASLEILSNAAGSPHHLGLSGTGCFLPTPSRERFGGLICGP